MCALVYVFTNNCILRSFYISYVIFSELNICMLTYLYHKYLYNNIYHGMEMLKIIKHYEGCRLRIKFHICIFRSDTYSNSYSQRNTISLPEIIVSYSKLVHLTFWWSYQNIGNLLYFFFSSNNEIYFSKIYLQNYFDTFSKYKD